MAIYPYAATTRRIRLRDLTHLVSGAVTSGAIVSFSILNQAGATVVGPTSGLADGDDWYADLTMPATAGTYHLHATATAGGATNTWHDTIIVKAFV